MRLRFPIAICLLATLSCSHGEPFTPLPNDSDEPFSSIGFPTRITFNRGKDAEAQWLPDGSGFVYTFEHFRFDEGDWCLGVLPATGGRQTRVLCASTVASRDSINAWRWAAVSSTGRLAYVRQANLPNREAPATYELVVASWGQPETIVALRPAAMTLPGTVTHGGLSQLRWLDDTTFVYRGDLAGLPRPCLTCRPDTVTSGRDLVLVTVGNGTLTSTLIPGTSYASSVAVRGSDEVFFTRADESIVYRWHRGTGTITVAHDFGGGIARGVQVAGNRLIATVGGNVAFIFHPAFSDSLLVDSGGFLHNVDLAGGSDGLVDQFTLWRNPVLSPDGLRLLVESPAPAPDLFMYVLP
jgi:hypothetical protein